MLIVILVVVFSLSNSLVVLNLNLKDTLNSC